MFTQHLLLEETSIFGCQLLPQVYLFILLIFIINTINTIIIINTIILLIIIINTIIILINIIDRLSMR